MSQIRGVRFIILFVFACAGSNLYAQTKIELVRHFVYNVPRDEPDNIRWERKLTNNPWKRYPMGIWLSYYVFSKTITDQEREELNDGTAKISSHISEKVATGMYRFDYDSEGWSGFFQLWFPAVKSIKKIEFFDKSNNKKFEDLFEITPPYTFVITKLSTNSFSVPSRSGVFLSRDRAKTWEVIDVDIVTNIFSIDIEIVNNANTVIVAIAEDTDPPYDWSVALWSPNPADYVFEFADDEEPEPQATTPAPSTTNSSLVKSSKKPEPKKSLLSRIFGK